MASQLDLRREAANLERFRANFGSQRGAEIGGCVHFPRPLRREGLVARSVLVETFVDGDVLAKRLEATRHRQRAADASVAAIHPAALVPPRNHVAGARNVVGTVAAAEEYGMLGWGRARDAELARRGLEAFFTMVLEHNFVHADLHPGNVIVAHHGDGAPLRLSFIDAGLAVELNERDRSNFKRLFLALGAGDGRRAARLMLEHATEQRCADPAAFEEGVERIVKGVGLGPRGAFTLDALRIGDVLLDLTTLVRVHQVKVEPNFTTLVMAIVVLEGLGRQLDPTLDLFDVALPMLL